MQRSKLLAIPAVIVMPLLYGCGKTTAISTQLELTGKWQLESAVVNNDTIRKPSKRQGMYDVSLTLKDKGELEATSANNYLTGFYETAQQNAIQMGGDGTERTDTGWGNLFVNALPNVSQYDLKPNRLVLYYDDNNALIFSRANSAEPVLASAK